MVSKIIDYEMTAIHYYEIYMKLSLNRVDSYEPTQYLCSLTQTKKRTWRENDSVAKKCNEFERF